MTHSAQPTAHARDGALRRLRGLTIGAAGTALGAVAVFAAIGAATIPGHSSSTAARSSTTSPSSSGTSSQTDATSSSLQTSSPPQAASPSSSGSSHAATGGS